MKALTNPVVKWESDTGNILHINRSLGQSHTLPSVGDIITRPFLIDPVTSQRIPYRVVEIQEHLGAEFHTFVVVVRRLGQYQ